MGIKFPIWVWIPIALFRIGFTFYYRYECHPDEYWQGTEIAYHLAYGGVSLPWEYKPRNALRSIIYPSIFSTFLKLFRALHIDSRKLVVFMLSVLFAICDLEFAIYPL